MIDRAETTVFLHIGLAKTGTSYLQTMLARNQGALLSHNIVYPDDVSLASARKGAITSGNGVAFAKFLGASFPSDQISTLQILPTISSALDAGRHVLFSSETMSILDDRSSARQAVDAIRALGCRVRVIAYFRSLADYALSDYSQQIKSGTTTLGFVDWLHESKAASRQDRVLTNALGVFHEEEIIALNYETGLPDLFRHFLTRALGIEDVSQFEFAPMRVNRSLTEVETLLMRAMAPVFTNASQARVASDAMLMSAPETSASRAISSHAMELIRARGEEGLSRINRLLGDDPVALASGDIEVHEAPERKLSEAEGALAAALAGIIRFGKVNINFE
ncbi:hypothetical protein [Parvibaculum sp.]|uniref:hypothetical protein n=1 Tax=Parvibaculum sp. TaxID=2024848 RepID=UPI002C3B7FE9|nr:hypothetical protein [Parvibaculum sp.]HUD50883.1 hypothetical protein [Parvibaculum sp.]